MNSTVARGLAIAATTAVAAGAKRAAEVGWERVTGDPPPQASDVLDDAGLRDLVLWAAVLTATIALARKLVTIGTRRFV